MRCRTACSKAWGAGQCSPTPTFARRSRTSAPDDLSHARTLFARAVETPGGLKIQTIHSFCSALLRQFPLEAGVSPAFRELDEEGQKTTINRVVDSLAETEPAVVHELARIYGGESLVTLSHKIAQKRAGPFRADEKLRRGRETSAQR